MRQAAAQGFDGGSTLVLALAVGQVLVVSNVGNSRAVRCSSAYPRQPPAPTSTGRGCRHKSVPAPTSEQLQTLRCATDGHERTCCNQSSPAVQAVQAAQAVRLSRDHLPDRPDERDRILASGGRVVVSKSGKARLQGELEVSRSVGDLPYRSVGLIATPEFAAAATLQALPAVEEVHRGAALFAGGCEPYAVPLKRNCLDSKSRSLQTQCPDHCHDSAPPLSQESPQLGGECPQAQGRSLQPNIPDPSHGTSLSSSHLQSSSPSDRHRAEVGKLLVLASDGVFEALTDDQVCGIAHAAVSGDKQLLGRLRDQVHVASTVIALGPVGGRQREAMEATVQASDVAEPITANSNPDSTPSNQVLQDSSEWESSGGSAQKQGLAFPSQVAASNVVDGAYDAMSMDNLAAVVIRLPSPTIDTAERPAMPDQTCLPSVDRRLVVLDDLHEAGAGAGTGTGVASSGIAEVTACPGGGSFLMSYVPGGGSMDRLRVGSSYRLSPRAVQRLPARPHKHGRRFVKQHSNSLDF